MSSLLRFKADTGPHKAWRNTRIHSHELEQHANTNSDGHRGEKKKNLSVSVSWQLRLLFSRVNTSCQRNNCSESIAELTQVVCLYFHFKCHVCLWGEIFFTGTPLLLPLPLINLINIQTSATNYVCVCVCVDKVNSGSTCVRGTIGKRLRVVGLLGR